MEAIELVDTESRREKTELSLSHGKKVPHHIGDIGFEVALSLTKEERRQFIDFLNGITGQQLDSQILPWNVIHRGLFSTDFVQKLLTPGMLLKLSKLAAKLPKLYDAAQELMANQSGEQSPFDSLSNLQKESIYEYLANLIVGFVREHNITVIKPLIMGPSIEVQVGLLSKIKERLGSESKDCLFAIELDWILGYLELTSPQFSFFLDKELAALAEIKLALGKKITKDLLKKLDKKGVKIDVVVACSDICGPDGPFKPSNVMDAAVYPYLEKEVEMFKKLGIKYFIKHTDGNVLAEDSEGKTCLGKMIECGIDAFQAIDPSCTDIKKAKEVALDKETGLPRICLIGGIDTATIENEENFKNHVWYCLESASVNGGYIPGATNDVSAPRFGQKARERYKIFSEIKKKYGNYHLDEQGVAKIRRQKSED